MKFGLSRNTIAEQMRSGIFSKPLASLLGPTKEVVTLVTSSSYTDRRLYDMMHAYISNKVVNYGGKLNTLFVLVDGKKKKLDYTTCDSLMRHVIKEDSELIAKVTIRNKHFEFEIKNYGGD